MDILNWYGDYDGQKVVCKLNNSECFADTCRVCGLAHAYEMSNTKKWGVV